MTSPYLLIPPRTLSQALADATARAIQELRDTVRRPLVTRERKAS